MALERRDLEAFSCIKAEELQASGESNWLRLSAAATVDYAIARDAGKVILGFCVETFDDPEATLKACLYATKRGHGEAAQRCMWRPVRFRLNRYYEHVREVARFAKSKPKTKAQLELAKAYRAGLPRERKELVPWLDAYGKLLAVTKDKAEQARYDAVVARVKSG